MTKTIWFAVAACALLSLGCVTQFKGSPHVGRAACEAKCGGQGMQLVGMVYMGNYSSACVCEVPRQTASASSSKLLAAAATAGGVAGVHMQTQRAQQQGQHMHAH